MRIPEPDAESLAASAALVAHLRREIADAGGVLPFDRYMQQALYAPGLGYYSAGRTKFGAAGDFVTAPELGDVYARCVARAIAPVLRETRGAVLELGAGSGAFAVDVLRALEALDAAPSRYRILEVSADLRARQRAHLDAALPAWRDRVDWLDAPPADAWDGVLFANEVIDALPVRAFARRDGGVFERGVASRDGDDPGRAFAWREWPADDGFASTVAARADLASLPTPYLGELCTLLEPWFAGITATLRRGLALFVDYGYVRRELYSPRRSHGTLMGHYRHRALDDVLAWPGLVDLTASVDFTAVAEAGIAAGFALAAYAPQAQFLIASGLPAVLEESATLRDADRYTMMQQVRRLTLPGEMGERFQAIAFSRGVDATAWPFTAADQRHRL